MRSNERKALPSPAARTGHPKPSPSQRLCHPPNQVAIPWGQGFWFVPKGLKGYCGRRHLYFITRIGHPTGQADMITLP
jgi:hypothetical protein